jgi:hypothetical protein
VKFCVVVFIIADMYQRLAQNAKYSSDEMTDIILLYGEAECSSADNVCLYTERYLQQQHPNCRTQFSGTSSVRKKWYVAKYEECW